jgi:hypothetical protein
MTSLECEICREDLTVSKKSSYVSCASCGLGGCLCCQEKYLLSCADAYHCMHCRKGWDVGFIQDHFTPAFYHGPLKESRQNILLDQQKAMLPGSRGDVAREVAKRKRVVDIIAQRDVVKEMKRALLASENVLTRITNSPLEGAIEETNAGESVGSYKCPAVDCRGFLVDWTCFVCACVVCESCLVAKGDLEHVCDGGDVRTMRQVQLV